MDRRQREQEERERAERQREQEERERAERQRREERKRQTRRMVWCSLLVLLFGLVFSYQYNKSSFLALKEGGHQVTEAPAQAKSEQLVKTEPEQQFRTKTVCSVNKEIKTNPTPPAAINVALLNVRSMNKNTTRILELIKQKNLHVFLSTETWLQIDNADRILREASPEDYSYCYQVRDGRRGGGVAMQYLASLQGEIIILDDIMSFEFVATALKHEEWDQRLLIINVYRPPDSNFDEFLDDFQRLLDVSLEHYSSVVVAGDFNIWVDTNNPSARRFQAVLEKYHLSQHVKEPTHRANHTLDLVMTRNVDISGLFVQDDNISDHHTVYFTARPKLKKHKRNLDDEEQTRRFKESEE